MLDLRWASGDSWSELVAPAIEAELVRGRLRGPSGPDRHCRAGPFTAERHRLGPRTRARAGEPVSEPDGPGLLDDAGGGRRGGVARLFGVRRPTGGRSVRTGSADLDPARAATLYQQVDRLLWQAMPAVPLFAEPTLLVSNADVTGVQADCLAKPGPLVGCRWVDGCGPGAETAAPKH